MRTIKKVLTLTAMAAALQACGGGNEIGPKLVAEPTTVASSTAVFNPAAGASGLPFPVDLVFNGTADGSVNLPGQPNSVPAGTDPSAFNPGFISLNTMDGFSTTAPMVVRFSDDIDDPNDALDIKDNVRIFRLTTADPGASAPTLSVDAELTFGVDFAAGVSGGTSMLIQQLRPLEPGKTHLVVIENGLKTTGGNPVSSDSTYALLSGSALFALQAPLDIDQSSYVFKTGTSDPCDFSDVPTSLADCTDTNPAYASAPAALAGAYASLPVSQLIQLEPLRRIVFKHFSALAVHGVPPAELQGIVLSYSVTTQNTTAALDQAKAQVDGLAEFDFPPATLADAPTIDVLNPKQDWDDVGYPTDFQTTSPKGAANIFLANLNGLLQFVDPDAPNSSTWEAVANAANWGADPLTPCPYLDAAATGSTNLVGCNAFKPAPKKTDHSIPVLISAPNDTVLAGCPAGDLPVVIYQHGITSSRGSLMAMADTLASQCVIGVAIDLPKHGIVPSGDTFSGLSQLHQALQQFPAPNPTPVLERLVQASSPSEECQAGTGVAISETSADFYCPSGDNFINLTNLANARDSLRQAVVDLHSLYRALANNDTSNDLTTSTIGRRIDAANIHFVGMSLGGIVGTPFVAQQGTNLGTATLNVAGGGIAKILDGSPSFEPSITTGLYEAAGLAKPGGDYEGFLIIAQTLVDNVDPINYAEDVAGSGLPVLAQEVIGNPADNITCLVDGTGCPDQVVPNNVFGASFGSAWGAVAQTGQVSYLANQNFITTPVALSGTDPLTQGTGFVAIGSELQKYVLSGGLLGISPTTAAGIGPIAVDLANVPATAIAFKGLNLPLVSFCGANADLGGASADRGVVRFTSGAHGSLLDPSADADVTYVMQKQMVTFVKTNGAAIANDDIDTDEDTVPDASAGVVFTPQLASASQAEACAGQITLP